MTPNEDLFAFLAAAPSPYHAVAEGASRLEAEGWTEVDLTGAWPSEEGRRFVRRGGALIAWDSSAAPSPEAPWRIVGAHTDSPGLRIKPRPDVGTAGWRQLAVEVYGGALWNSWLDRDLGLSGRVMVDIGASFGAPVPGVAVQERLILVDEPLLRIPQLAIHLDRDVNGQGLKLNPQQHLTPVWGTGAVEAGGFRRFLAERLDVDPTTILTWDVMVHDLTPPGLLGRDRELIAAGRLDNLLSCWAGIRALTAHDAEPRAIPLVCLFDHEEVGSVSADGAAGALLPQVIERSVLARGGDRDHLIRSLAGSVCASVDMAHATHPNHPERHDPAHPVLIDGGPVIKINANQRYATDAGTAAVIVDACSRAGVPHQSFVSRNDLPCGSTIGPTTAARLGIPTVDVGVAQLSMHSARELCGAEDPARLGAALTAFLRP